MQPNAFLSSSQLSGTCHLTRGKFLGKGIRPTFSDINTGALFINCLDPDTDNYLERNSYRSRDLPFC